ncbi:hypothetical protein DBR06_SOUSAS30910011, partial [Sousa chinensis]
MPLSTNQSTIVTQISMAVSLSFGNSGISTKIVLKTRLAVFQRMILISRSHSIETISIPSFTSVQTDSIINNTSFSKSTVGPWLHNGVSNSALGHPPSSTDVKSCKRMEGDKSTHTFQTKPQPCFPYSALEAVLIFADATQERFDYKSPMASNVSGLCIP